MSNKVISVSTRSEAAEDRGYTYMDIDMLSKYTGNPRPGASKREINALTDIQAVQNSLYNVFTWLPGERVLMPEFGSNVRKLLYEGITAYNMEQITAEIRHSVSTWEPRVRIDEIINVTSTEDVENNTVYIRIIYSIPGLTDQQFAYDLKTPKA